MARRLINIRHRDLHPGPNNPAKRRLLPRSRAVLGCAVATVLITGGVAPANADRLKQTDATGDMTAFTESSKGVTSAPAPNHHAGDVTSAKLRHGRHAVTIRLTFAELRRSHLFNASSGKLRAATETRRYFVQDEQNARPRLYVLNNRFRRTCRAATLDVDYQANTMAIRVPRECLNRPNWVKATATSANQPGNQPGSGSFTYYVDDAFSATPVVDAEQRATWTARVKRG